MQKIRPVFRAKSEVEARSLTECYQDNTMTTYDRNFETPSTKHVVPQIAETASPMIAPPALA